MINLVNPSLTQRAKLQVNSNSLTNQTQQSFIQNSLADSISLNKTQNNLVMFKKSEKSIGVVSFTGLKNPQDSQKPALQMKVTGVTRYQKSSDPSVKSKGISINRLADSNWKDGDVINFAVDSLPNGKPIISLRHPKFGPIGRVPDEIAKKILPSIERNPEAYKFELSNIIAGTTKGAETIGLRVNLLYTGNSKAEEERVKETFNEVLNSEECREKVLLFQPKTSPKEVLKMILDYEKKVNGPESAKEMDQVINNIVDEINNPQNKKILLLGHCKPDGDTIGCVLGLKNAIGLLDSGKQVDCAIDDKVPGLFRSKVPGIDKEIKRPASPEYVASLKEQIKTLEKRPQDAIVKDQIQALKDEIKVMNDPDNLLNPDEQYDLVITMDVPTPSRFSDKFKKYFDTAKKEIYIDHHPHRINEWDKAKTETGLDMKQVHKDGLAWIADAVPAATQLVAILAEKMIPNLDKIALDKAETDEQKFDKLSKLEKLNAFSAATVVGMSTDTGAFTRTANLLPEHMTVPVQNRPNFMPEGLSKWLMDITNGGITKKWIREEITYDITDQKSANLDASAREKMLNYAVEGRTVNPDLSLGTITVDYDKMYDVWKAAREIEPETTLLDVQNGFKYSEALNVLRSDPAKSGANKAQGKKTQGNQKSTSIDSLAKENYTGKYDADRVAVLIMQDKKAGQLDEKMQIADQNGLRISIRSAEGSIHAELLCSLFGGGGHGGAAGARLDLPGVTVDTPLAVEIDGKIEKDSSKVLKELQKNYEIMHDRRIPDNQKAELTKNIKVVENAEGKNCAALIEDIVSEIRTTQPAISDAKTKSKPKSNRKGDIKAFERPANKHHRRSNISFTGMVDKLFNKKAV